MDTGNVIFFGYCYLFQSEQSTVERELLAINPTNSEGRWYVEAPKEERQWRKIRKSTPSRHFLHIGRAEADFGGAYVGDSPLEKASPTKCGQNHESIEVIPKTKTRIPVCSASQVVVATQVKQYCQEKLNKPADLNLPCSMSTRPHIPSSEVNKEYIMY